MDKPLFLAYNLVDQDYRILALHHTFSTLYDRHIKFHELDQVHRLMSKENKRILFHQIFSEIFFS